MRGAELRHIDKRAPTTATVAVHNTQIRNKRALIGVNPFMS